MNELLMAWISFHSEKSDEDLKRYFDARAKDLGEKYWSGMISEEITADILEFFSEDQSVQK